jgi:hypothetical protein
MLRARGIVLIGPKIRPMRELWSFCSCFDVELLVGRRLRIELSKYGRCVHFVNNGARSLEIFGRCALKSSKQRTADDFNAPRESGVVVGPEDGKVQQIIRPPRHGFVHIPDSSALPLELERCGECRAGAKLDIVPVGEMEPPLPLHEMLHQVQEEDLPPAMDAVGWKSK